MLLIQSSRTCRIHGIAYAQSQTFSEVVQSQILVPLMDMV